MIAWKHLSKTGISNLINRLMILFNSLIIYYYPMRYVKVLVLGFLDVAVSFIYLEKP